jgi:hypothetical protein
MSDHQPLRAYELQRAVCERFEKQEQSMSKTKYLGAIPAWQARIQRRKQRTERKNFLRFLREHSDPRTRVGSACLELSQRVYELKRDSATHGDVKIRVFGRVLDDYAAAVTEDSRAIVDEAASGTDS